MGGGSSSRSEDPESDQRREAVLEALRTSIDPLTPGEVLKKSGIDSTAAGAAAILRWLERNGQAVRVETGWGLPANVDTETSTGSLADLPA